MKKIASFLIFFSTIISLLAPACYADNSFEIGDIVGFGRYEQDNSKKNGAENIEWIVLNKDGDFIFLISRYILDQHRYHDTFTATSWDRCDLREWLNNDFLDTAFTEEEQAIIANNYIENDGKSEDTYDKVFLLSVEEALDYFETDKERRAEPTEYALKKGVYCAYDKPYGWWWLRSRANYDSYAAFIDTSGKNHTGGEDVSKKNIGIRPCIWVYAG